MQCALCWIDIWDWLCWGCGKINFIPEWEFFWDFWGIKNSHGEDIIVVQIAGLVARRIVTDTSVEENVEQGSRIGMIRFGSRADLYFENYEPLVKVNQRAVAGETLIAKR